MNIRHYRFLLADRGTLKKLIASSSPSNVIGRMSLEHRLRKVEAELEEYKGYSPRSINTTLTFTGNPVVGNHGINADFGSNAVKAFANAVAQVGASQQSPLSPRGPVPNSEEYQLLITGITGGSFGFHLEDASQKPTLMEETAPIETAIQQVKEILKASVGTDEQLADAIAETDQRALKAVSSFLNTVADSEAVCNLEFKGDIFKFRNTEQVRKSQKRLSQDNIQENEDTFTGEFIGFLPTTRQAEFHISESHEEPKNENAQIKHIIGKVNPEVVNDINITQILREKVSVNIHTRRVGSGKPRHTITNCKLIIN